MELDIYQKNGKKTSKKVSLEAKVFGVEPNEHSIYLAINSEMAAMRQGTHSSKTKGEVCGTGAKPWRQKGTGRSRIGYIRNPSRVHGSKAFGPKPHKYTKKVNRKVKILARKSILSRKVLNNKLLVIDEFSLTSPKTKEFASILKNLKIENWVVLPATGTGHFGMEDRRVQKKCIFCLSKFFGAFGAETRPVYIGHFFF